MTPLADAAAFLAQQWPVFPCGANKRPVTEHGFYDASQDVPTVRAMFAKPGAALIGVPMGKRSGLFLLDIDVRHGGDEWLQANAHRLPRTRTHRSMSGGWHFFYLWPAGRQIRNRASKWAPGVDIRGEGGYAIMPPSAGYVIEDDAMPCAAPGWLLDLIDPPAPPPRPAEPYQPPRHDRLTRYAEAALDEECRAVANAAEGTRNDRLNTAAFSLGTLVAVNALSEAVARDELRRAALHAGLEPRETALTIESGLTAGKQHPREIPERAAHTSTAAHPHVAPSAPAPGSGQFRGETAPLTDGGQPRTLPLVYWPDIRPSLGADDFVEGLLIKGGMSVIYGPSNCGKTFWASDLAMHVATGRAWNGRDIEGGGVIYCALEGSYGIQNRVAAWKKHHGLEGAGVPFAVIPVAVNMLDPAADTERVIDAIREAAGAMGCPVVWVIFDTLSRAMAGGNENSPEDMGALVTNGTRVQQVTQAHVSWIHHCGKDQAQGARGHSLLRAATDTEIEISRENKDSPSTARVTKQRELEIEGEWSFTLHAIELGKNRRGKPVTSCVVMPSEVVVRKGLQLSQGAKFGLAALQEAVIAGGQPLVSPNVPNWARAVRVDAWRQAFYQRSHLDNYQAKKKAFQRAINELRQADAVGVFDDWAWIADAKNPV
jgi:hypothetical protein